MISFFAGRLLLEEDSFESQQFLEKAEYELL